MSRVDDAKPVSFGPGVDEVRERLNNPVVTTNEPIKSASQYSQRVKERLQQTQSLKREKVPLGGAEPIPPGKLAALTMPKPSFDTKVDNELPPPINKQEMIQGMGSAYPINQALSKGEIKRPVSMREAQQMGGVTSKGLSDETVEGLKKIQEQQQKQDKEEPVAPAEESQNNELVEAEKDIASTPPIDFAALIGARNELFTEERRKRIEDRLKPLDIADMITQREIKQTVPVIPGKFEIMLRTFNQIENLFCLRHVGEYQGTGAYQEELLNTFKVVCGVVAINGSLLPEHRKNIGQKDEDVDTKMFKEKLHSLSAFPVQLMADLSVQNIWFQRRVEKLFSWENLKNG